MSGSDQEDEVTTPAEQARLTRLINGARAERAENEAQRVRDILEDQRRKNELARLEAMAAEWEDRCHCGGRYSLCTVAQRLARYRRPSEIYVHDPTRPPPRRFVTGIDFTKSDEGVEAEFEVRVIPIRLK